MLDLSTVTPFSAKPYPFNELQEKWLQELETTEAPQARYALETSKGFCCLGLACGIAGAEREETFNRMGGNLSGENFIRYTFEGAPAPANGYPPHTLVNALGLRGMKGDLGQTVKIPGRGYFYSLTGMNDEQDGKRLSFKEIAQFIRHDPWNVFYTTKGEQNAIGF